MASPSKHPKTESLTSSEMDQATARRLFEDGGTLVFLEVPPGTEFGIDYNSWNVGTEFRGVKMIPPGVHFVFYGYVEIVVCGDCYIVDSPYFKDILG